MIEGAERLDERAAHFVAARLEARALSDYPGAPPRTLAEAYAVQDAAIDLWPDEVAGWKIGLIPADQREALGAERIAGPIFQADIQRAGASPALLPVFAGGFGAVEAEFVFRIVRDAPPRADWTPESAAGYADALFIGVENAGSPLAAINDLGAAVTASDFGNNAGLVLGAAIADWQKIPFEALVASTTVNGARVGEGDAARIPGSPLAALAFILDHAAARGRPLRKGQFISTGAVTGVHVVGANAVAEADFGRFGAIRCRTVPASARARERTPGRRTEA